jgi:hypothetical protein
MKTVKSPIPSSLKVDSLKHLHDHGLSVRFTDPKLVSLVEHLNSKDGKTVLSAGKSALTVTRFGRVVLTEAFWNVGSRRVAAIHYADAPAQLKFSLSREGGSGADSENAFNTLRAVIFGGSLPIIFRPNTGADQDKLRAFLRSYAWTLSGEAGMRSRALASAGAALRSDISLAKNSLSYAERELARLRENTFEIFRKQHVNIRQHCANRLSAIDAKLDAVATDCAVNFSALSEEQLKELSARYGAYSRFLGVSASRFSGYDFAFSAVAESISPPRVRNNYVATIGTDGETITFNSGIQCPFTVSRLLAWLRGQAPAPRTTYGEVKKLERTSRDGLPIVVLQCGCHEIDAVATSPALFSELLKPSHSVSIVPGKDSAVFGTPEFFARLSEEMQDRRSALVDERAGALLALATRKHELTEEENTLPARIDAQLAKVEAERVTLTKAESALASFVAPLGASAEDSLNNGLAVFSAFARFL